jgi:hypothetical protein
VLVISMIKMVKKEISQTANAIYLREKYAKEKAAKGPKPLIPPPQNVGWIQHHSNLKYYGKPDGQVWSAKRGRALVGYMEKDGYHHIRIDGKLVKRSRFNLSLSLGRAIKEGFDCDHIVPVEKGGGDDWSNLQELSRPDHNRKTAEDNPDVGTKSGITRGIPIIARHTVTGVEMPFSTISEAVRDLGIYAKIIERSLKGEMVDFDYVFSRAPEHLADQADLPGEKWREAVSSWGLIPNTEASDCGRVQESFGRRSFGRSYHAYKDFGTTVAGKLRCLQVHDVITRTFHGPPPSPEHTVDHINGDPSDNRAKNLRWATKKEQGRNRIDNHSVAQLDSITGEQLAVFGSIAEASEATGIVQSNISTVASGRRSTAGGFGWKSVSVE